jgi:hypothetical protein
MKSPATQLMTPIPRAHSTIARRQSLDPGSAIPIPAPTLAPSEINFVGSRRKGTPPHVERATTDIKPAETDIQRAPPDMPSVPTGIASAPPDLTSTLTDITSATEGVENTSARANLAAPSVQSARAE